MKLNKPHNIDNNEDSENTTPESLRDILIRRDNLSEKEADREIKDMQIRVINRREDPEEVLADYGLEPDYVVDLITL